MVMQRASIRCAIPDMLSKPRVIAHALLTKSLDGNSLAVCGHGLKVLSLHPDDCLFMIAIGLPGKLDLFQAVLNLLLLITPGYYPP